MQNDIFIAVTNVISDLNLRLHDNGKFIFDLSCVKAIKLRLL